MSNRMRLGSMAGTTALTALSLAIVSAAGLAAPARSAEQAPATSAVRLDALTPEQKAFVDNAENLRLFGLTKEKLLATLAGRDAEGVKTAVAAMMQTLADAKYQPAGDAADDRAIPELLDPVGDMAAVPLNTQAGRFNGSTVLRPAALDEFYRAPGPFSLKRYMYEEDPIPTFAGAPVALRKEDLVVGKTEVAFVGVPLNLGSGYRDSQNAPAVLRAMYGMGGYDIYAGIDPAVELSIVDYGNISVDRMSVEMSVGHVRTMIGEMLGTGTIPFVVGGDHSIMFPSVAAMADKYGADNLGVVHFDAHFNGERDLPQFYSDKQAVSALIERGVVRGSNVVQVGIRGSELTEADLKWMQEQGVRMHTMAEIESKGWEPVLASALRQVQAGPKNVFISFDISVLDPAYATAAGRPSPGGLTMREVVPMVRRLCAETHVVGFELLDVAPYLDLSYASALNANYVMHACLTGIAMRKKGISAADYLSPLTTNGGK